MSVSLWLILVFLLLSAFFSGMEIAFLSSNKLKIEIDRQQNKFYAGIIGESSAGQKDGALIFGNEGKSDNIDLKLNNILSLFVEACYYVPRFPSREVCYSIKTYCFFSMF